MMLLRPADADADVDEAADADAVPDDAEVALDADAAPTDELAEPVALADADDCEAAREFAHPASAAPAPTASAADKPMNDLLLMSDILISLPPRNLRSSNHGRIDHRLRADFEMSAIAPVRYSADLMKPSRPPTTVRSVWS